MISLMLESEEMLRRLYLSRLENDEGLFFVPLGFGDLMSAGLDGRGILVLGPCSRNQYFETLTGRVYSRV